MRILLVEDETELATWLIKALEQNDFVVDWSNDGLVAEKILSVEQFDAVILDLGLPGKSGHAVLYALRKSGNRVPVLVLTARNTLTERVSSLNEGADDFLAKPFALSELEARLHALIRRSHGKAHIQNIFSCAALSYDIAAKMFTLSGAPIALTPREHGILGVLVQHVGEPIPKRVLLERVFARNDDIHIEAIEVLVYRLRKKLAGSGVRIVTMRGFGYCLEDDTEIRELA